MHDGVHEEKANYIVSAMKVFAVVCLCLTGIATLRIPASAQGTFGNLNFESANVPILAPGQGGFVSSLGALPGWSVYFGSSQVSRIVHNAISTGSASVSILGPVWDNSFEATIIDGQYSAVLQAGVWNGEHVSASITQTGTVPADAESITMKIVPFFGGGTIGVFIGSQPIPMVVLSKDSNGLLMGGDVSAFAGKQAELRISSLTVPNSFFGSLVVDDIAFSSQSIPEPHTMGLLLAGLLALPLARPPMRSPGANPAASVDAPITFPSLSFRHRRRTTDQHR